MGARILRATTVGLLAIALGGCFLQFTLGRVIISSISEFVDRVITSIVAEATISICRADGEVGLQCLHFVNGKEIASTMALVDQNGFFGVLVDPVVIEVPVEVTGIGGTWSDNVGSSGPLAVEAGRTVIPADDRRSMSAGPGKQLVILDLPDGVFVDDRTYSFSLQFEQMVSAGTPPPPIRGLFTGKVQRSGRTYYPPILPCTTNLEQVPAITVPVADTPQPLTLPTAGISGCNNVFYTFRALFEDDFES